MKILIVEDDSHIRNAISDHFKSFGWHITEAMDGQLGYDLAIEKPFDLMILDVMLPQVSGFEICKAVRAEGKICPIIMLTAKAEEEDVLRGFQSGATDYVRKPFSLAELTARVKIHSKEESNNKIELGELELDLTKKELTIRSETHFLTIKETDLLAFLMKNSGKVMTREAILNRVWGNTYLQGTRSVDRCVKTLRKKIEPNPPSPTYIKTVRQVGYVFSVG